MDKIGKRIAQVVKSGREMDKSYQSANDQGSVVMPMQDDTGGIKNSRMGGWEMGSESPIVPE